MRGGSNIPVDSIKRTDGFVGSGFSKDGFEARRYRFDHCHGDDTIVAVWKAEAGHFGGEKINFSETLIILEGKAEITLGSSDPVVAEPGMVLQCGYGDRFYIRVIEPFKMICFARYPDGQLPA